MAEKFIIKGGKSLKGEIEARGAKNAVFPILAATLLTKDECEISNIPLIEDVFRMVEILESIGVEIFLDEKKRTLKLRARDIDPSKIRKDLILKLRGSVLFFGSLLARFREVRLPPPGGCIIGARPITTHLDAFSQAGVKIIPSQKDFKFKLDKLPKHSTIILNEFSVTATENLMLLLSLNQSENIIKIADADYQVQELAKFLIKMGVEINGIGTHTLKIRGLNKLHGVKHRLIYDPIEAGTFILMAGASRGEVTIKNVEMDFLELPLKRLKNFGLPFQILDKSSIKVFPWKTLKINKVQSLPYPGIPSDLQSAFGVLATQAQGSTLIHDPLYEGRLKYLEELNKMGAEIYFADPHRAIINGPTRLFGKELKTFDLRGGMALIIAGLIAKGTTIIDNIYQVDRGYERIEERLKKLGADIKRIKQ
ncbi:MAG: UDP-N-acetylglucosamine 1-carboxyvinyltransferase [Patescibacteria group bacterium]|nr:UDP-N-acetylglucosamine 1-carboxyvinyltransferase [Patescibacteria group bacterium]